jgi:hypothetical protein
MADGEWKWKKLPIREIRTTIATNHAIPTRFPRCELSKLLHRSKLGKKGICPQITQIPADTESRPEQQNTERIPMGIGISSVPSCSKNLHLRQSASICGQFWIRLRLAAR